MRKKKSVQNLQSLGLFRRLDGRPSSPSSQAQKPLCQKRGGGGGRSKFSYYGPTLRRLRPVLSPIFRQLIFLFHGLHGDRGKEEGDFLPSSLLPSGQSRVGLAHKPRAPENPLSPFLAQIARRKFSVLCT